MTSRDFVFWLQGYLEINAAYASGSSLPAMTSTQVACVQKHLALVFVHEIDPSMPSKTLDKVHSYDGPLDNVAGHPKFRC